VRAVAAAPSRSLPLVLSRHLAPAGVVALAGALRFTELSARGFWRDEAVTVRLVRRSFGGMLSAIPHSEGTPPVYYVLLWGWTRIFGSHEAGLRSLSALAGTAAVAVVYAIGVELFSRRVALATALLAAVNPLLVWHSQDGRAYALFTLVGGLSFLTFLRALDRPSNRALAAWAVVSALALGTHYFGIFLLVPEAVTLLAVLRPRRRLIPPIVAIAVVGAALLPLALDQRSNASVSWIAEIPRAQRLRELAEQFLVGPQSPRTTSLALLGLVGILVGVVLLLARGDDRERRGALIAFGVGGGAVVLAFVLSFAGVDYFLARNLIVAWVPLALVVAAGLAGNRAGIVGAAVLTAMLVLGVAVVVATAHDPKFGGEDWRGAARALGRPTEPRAVVLWLGVGADSFDLYRQNAGPLQTGGARVREVDVVSVGPDHADLGARRAHLYPPSPFRQVGRTDAAHYSIVRFRAPSPQLVRRSSLVSGGPGYSAAVLLDQR